MTSRGRRLVSMITALYEPTETHLKVVKNSAYLCLPAKHLIFFPKMDSAFCTILLAPPSKDMKISRTEVVIPSSSIEVHLEVQPSPPSHLHQHLRHDTLLWRLGQSFLVLVLMPMEKTYRKPVGLKAGKAEMCARRNASRIVRIPNPRAVPLNGLTVLCLSANWYFLPMGATRQQRKELSTPITQIRNAMSNVQVREIYIPQHLHRPQQKRCSRASKR